MNYLTKEEYIVMMSDREFIGEVPHEKQTNFEYVYACYVSRACAAIRTATRGRIDKMATVPEEVKNLCCELINYLHENDWTKKGVSSRSQTAGSVSESENYTVKTLADCEKDIDNMIYDYLCYVYNDNGVSLLYRGCGD